jgi:hypothetical protein
MKGTTAIMTNGRKGRREVSSLRHPRGSVVAIGSDIFLSSIPGMAEVYPASAKPSLNLPVQIEFSLTP